VEDRDGLIEGIRKEGKKDDPANISTYIYYLDVMVSIIK